ncbi:MAG: 50S ribosomal protein L21 [Alphaproteobacteria bacterium]|nr:50S ribosomal protein L21 [Alphaproteobacteria bacterium]
MFAVIRTGGKQYRVVANDVLEVERLPGEAGAEIAFDEVLMVGSGAQTTVGTPLVGGARVKAKVLEQMRGPKVIVFKKKRRKNYRRRNGHRQELTVVRITGIESGAA